jgi:hypothetical protein
VMFIVGDQTKMISDMTIDNNLESRHWNGLSCTNVAISAMVVPWFEQ